MSAAMQPAPLPLAFCCFTCRRDVDLLPLHYDAIQLAAPGAPVVYAVDAAEQDMVLPEGSRMLVTDWHRRGNLIGQNALVGILRTLKQVAEDYNAVPVKIDSDIMLAGVGWLLSIRHSELGMVGVCPGQLFCASGACYAMQRRTIEAALEYIASGVYFDAAQIRVEDETVSMLAALVNPPDRVFFFQYAYPHTVLASIFKAEHFENPRPLEMVQAWVDCGDRKMLNQPFCQNRPKEAIKREAMERTLEVLKNKVKSKE